MRKSALLLIILVVFLALPVAAHAQTTVTFNTLKIQFWPDYDQPAVLVIYDFSVSTDTNVPILVNLRMPAGAQLLAVAKDENGALVNVQHQLPVRQGTYDVLTFTVTDRSQHHVEFYIPYTRDGNKRSFTYVWPGDYAVGTLNVQFQEPVDAKNIVAEPSMVNVGSQPDGFVYHTMEQVELPAGEEITFKFSYEKDTDTLSSTSLGVQPTSPLDQPVSGQSSFMSFLPWILGGLGVVLIVGGGLWYWFSGQSSRGSGRSRKRHASGIDEDEGVQVYCSQCGKRAQPGDRFCRACGAKLRSGE
jgi:hypothetical protein